MQDLCRKYDIPTAKYEVFNSPEKAKAYIRQQAAPIVVKADGLAAGKGVIVAASSDEACAAVDDMLVNKAFGSAGRSSAHSAITPLPANTVQSFPPLKGPALLRLPRLTAVPWPSYTSMNVTDISPYIWTVSHTCTSLPSRTSHHVRFSL